MTVSFTVKNKDASKNLPKRSATARAAWSEETMLNELQHATRWRPSVGLGDSIDSNHIAIEIYYRDHDID